MAVVLNDGRIMQVNEFVRNEDGTAGFETLVGKAYDAEKKAPVRSIRGKYPHDKAYTWSMRQAPNGDVILGAYYLENTPRLDPKIGTAHFFRTRPDGDSWEYLAAMDNPGKFHISESDFCFSPDGRWIALLRTDWGLWSNDEKPADADGYGFARGGYGYYLYQTESLDQGQTWSQPRRLPIWGHPPFLLPLKSGKVLLVNGARRDPWTIEAVLSHDHGRTWDVDNTRILYRSNAVGIDYGNPVATQLESGKIVCVTYDYASGDSRQFSARAIYAITFDESLFENSATALAAPPRTSSAPRH